MKLIKHQTIKIAIISFLLISVFLVTVSNSQTFHLFIVWTSILVLCLSVGFDILHPYVWFSVSFGLYGTSYAILDVLNYPINSIYDRSSMIYVLIALLNFMVFIPPKASENNHVNIEFKKIKFINKTGYLKASIFVVLLLIVITLVLRGFNFTHKNQLLESNNIFFQIAAYLTRIMSFLFPTYYLYSHRQIRSVLIVFASVLMFTLFTGEKDAIFRTTLVILLVLYYNKKIEKKHFIFIIPIGISFLIASNYFKYYFVNGTLRTSIFDNTILYNFLTSDFNAAGDNFQLILNNSSSIDSFGIRLLVIDFIKPFVIGGRLFNVSQWFHNRFYYGSYSRAFTLLGEGYLINSIIGIPLLFGVISIIISYLYKNMNKNNIRLSLYIFSIPTFIQIFRATLGSFFDIMIRVSLFSLAIVVFFSLSKRTDKS